MNSVCHVEPHSKLLHHRRTTLILQRQCRVSNGIQTFLTSVVPHSKLLHQCRTTLKTTIPVSNHTHNFYSCVGPHSKLLHSVKPYSKQLYQCRTTLYTATPVSNHTVSRPSTRHRLPSTYNASPSQVFHADIEGFNYLLYAGNVFFSFFLLHDVRNDISSATDSVNWVVPHSASIRKSNSRVLCNAPGKLSGQGDLLASLTLPQGQAPAWLKISTSEHSRLTSHLSKAIAIHVRMVGFKALPFQRSDSNCWCFYELVLW